MKVLICNLLVFFIMAGVSGGIKAQQIVVDPTDTVFVQSYAHFDFKGCFAVKTLTDETNNYYLVNFSLLPGRFDRVYFMNLVFKYPEVVNIDPEITRDRIWFQANKRYPEKQVIDVLSEVRQKTDLAVKAYTDAEKSKWLKENDKYK